MLRKPRRRYNQKRQISKNTPVFKKIERNYDEKTGTNAKQGGANNPNLQKNSAWTMDQPTKFGSQNSTSTTRTVN